uniref:Uncharacterized protein n=1 Tax=Lactuca sativa TaxID=4236 RepID=A0A9R1WM23_LACSA|nr:hypothetical protein LSAT_V11C100024110 [Lactuca sativa]
MDSGFSKWRFQCQGVRWQMEQSIFSLLQCVTIVVVAVLGLPLAVTLTLAYSMRKMMSDIALVSFIILFTINLSGAFWVDESE